VTLRCDAALWRCAVTLRCAALLCRCAAAARVALGWGAGVGLMLEARDSLPCVVHGVLLLANCYGLPHFLTPSFSLSCSLSLPLRLSPLRPQTTSSLWRRRRC
jgi:hypothetical protein